MQQTRLGTFFELARNEFLPEAFTRAGVMRHDHLLTAVRNHINLLRNLKIPTLLLYIRFQFVFANHIKQQWILNYIVIGIYDRREKEDDSDECEVAHERS